MFKIKPAKHLIAGFLRFQGFWALTAPWGVIYVLPEILGAMLLDHEIYPLIRHEREHEAQMKRDGRALFMVKYCWYCLRHGYWDNPYEIAARNAEDA